MKAAKYILPGVILAVAGLLVFKNITPKAVESGEAARSGRAESKIPQAEASEDKPNRVRRPKDSAQDRALREEIEKSIADATDLFKKRDIPGALKILDHANEIGGPNGNVLTLRGSCYMETREFDKALPDMKMAVELSPGYPILRFNLAEVHFVTKQWQEALDVYENMRELIPAENVELARLVDLKTLLCLSKLGKTEEAAALAAKYDANDPSPYYWYAQAAIAAEAGDKEKETQFLVQASQKFPDRGRLAPWQDTMHEYRRPMP